MSCKETLIHGVHVFGAHLLHPKMLEVIAYALEVGVGNKLNAIFISPYGPTDRLGDYDKFNQTISISIPGIVKKAVNISEQNSTMNGFSITAICWQELIYTMFHELHHNIAYENHGDEREAKGWDEIEEGEAHEYALEMTEDAIIRLKAEVPEMSEFVAINEALNILLNEKVDQDDEWPAQQRARIEEGIVYECETETYMSLVDYYLMTCENPEKFNRENSGAAVALKVETPNLYDRGMPKEIGGDTGNTLAAVAHSLNTMAQSAEGGEMEPNEDGSISVVSDPNGSHAQGMKEKGATDEHIARAMRNHQRYGLGSQPNEGWEASAEDIDNAMDVDAQVIADETEGEDEDLDLPSTEESTPTPASVGPAALFTGAAKTNPAPTAPVTPPSQPSLFPSGNPANVTPAPAVAPQENVSERSAMIRNVIVRLVEHAHNVCGFNRGTYANPNAIYNIPLILTLEEKATGVFVGSKTMTNTGMGYADVTATGGITGQLYKDGKLPAYELLLNLGGPKCEVIRVVLQNAEKNSKAAARARAGERIAWVIDADKDAEKTWIGKVENGKYEAM